MTAALFPRPEGTDTQQLSLLGDPRPVRTPAKLWRVWLTDSATQQRFEAKRYRRGTDQCWPWIGAISSTGHGSFRAASLPGLSRRGTVPAHLYAYQLEHGIIDRLGWSALNDSILCHRCDYAGCTNPHHLRLGTATDNRTEYLARRHGPNSPLADTRGPAGLSRAIAAAIRNAHAAGESPHIIDRRINDAADVGRPWSLW
ncbi:hypothetical protein [Dietzia sp. ANT_WB102]|uniref:hypothetical protein n=1 Tax=Dietzia sp. ANT_WB102 TaxID=2597345 RepID=UPI0011EEA68A|nr:hypothetical protein [Dietzia sp. ANT_WB102]KAA0918888.1 hypothetical protein FQ137_06160 [Dietzia sp. ANT_WB102]